MMSSATGDDYDDMRETYLHFVQKRHDIWLHRQADMPQPWTADPILRGKKFTNVFRVLDHGSQFLVRELLYGDSPTFEDALMRCFLYRYTNIPEPWEAFYQTVGMYPQICCLRDDLPMVWKQHKAEGKPIFGTAFKMFVGAENKGTDRLTWILNLTRRYFLPESPDCIVKKFMDQYTMQGRLDVLRTIPRCADFMAMQIVTDIGYGPWVVADENEMILPGPGCKRGAGHLFENGHKDAGAIVYWCQRRIHESLDRVVLQTPNAYRSPSLMDVQNTLCEFQKYVRYLGNPPPAQPYLPKHPGPQPKPVLPVYW
jgi:hypothetical protein